MLMLMMIARLARHAFPECWVVDTMSPIIVCVCAYGRSRRCRFLFKVETLSLMRVLAEREPQEWNEKYEKLWTFELSKSLLTVLQNHNVNFFAIRCSTFWQVSSIASCMGASRLRYQLCVPLFGEHNESVDVLSFWCVHLQTAHGDGDDGRMNEFIKKYDKWQAFDLPLCFTFKSERLNRWQKRVGRNWMHRHQTPRRITCVTRNGSTKIISVLCAQWPLASGTVFFFFFVFHASIDVQMPTALSICERIHLT